VNPGDLLKVSVTVPLEAEEAMTALVERVFRQAPALYTDEETLWTEVSVFLPAERGLGARSRTRLEAGLQRLRAQGVPVGRGVLRVREVPRRNWAEAWKRHFKPLDIGGRLLVKPSWSRRRPRPGQVVMELDPGLSFGTGQHPTTAFCLEQIVAEQPGNEPKSLLDVGTGSGILAIAAAKLGYEPIDALDVDPAAVKVARANAALNGVGRQIGFQRADLRRWPAKPARRYAVVCANLLADLLTTEVERLTRRVSPGGTLVLAGILAAEFAAVCELYERAGWQLVADRQVKEWRSGSFRRGKGP
jgi:ribosomal protein L11 methyltransferase